MRFTRGCAMVLSGAPRFHRVRQQKQSRSGWKSMAGNKTDNDLIDREIVRSWLTCGFFWAILAPLLGIILSLKFNYPTFLSTEFSHFGRLRPLHVNGVIFGVFSSIFLGLAYYMVPTLTR